MRGSPQNSLTSASSGTTLPMDAALDSVSSLKEAPISKCVITRAGQSWILSITNSINGAALRSDSSAMARFETPPRPFIVSIHKGPVNAIEGAGQPQEVHGRSACWLYSLRMNLSRQPQRKSAMR